MHVGPSRHRRSSCARVLAASTLALAMLVGDLAAQASGPASARSVPPPPQMRARRWSMPEGLPQASVNCLLQTRDGYLWVGTFGGLVRFDGARFVVHEVATTPGLASNRILTLAEGLDGALWIGTQEARVSRLRDGRFETVGPDDDLGAGAIWKLHVDGKGTVWAATTGGVLRWDGTRFVRPDLDDPLDLARQPATDFVDGRGGRLYVSGHAGLLELDPRAGTLRQLGSLGDTEPVLSVARSADGTLWLGGESLWRRDPDGTLALIPGSTGTIWDLVLDHEQTLWVASDGAPQRVVDGRVQPVAGVSVFQATRALLLDRDHDVWAGTTHDGLLSLRRGELVGYGPEQGLPDSAFVVAPSARGGVWIGQFSGLKHFDGEQIETWVPDREVMALLPEGDDVLFGTRDGDLFRLRDGRHEAVDMGAQRLKAINALLRDGQGRLWVGGEGGVRVRTDGAWQDPTGDDGLLKGVVHALFEDRNGTLWIGTTQGIARRRAGAWLEPLRSGEQLPPGTVRAFHQDSTGAVWIGTYGGGLSRWQSDELRTLTTADGLTENVVSVILPKGSGHVVMNGNRGVSHYELEQLHAVADGLRDRVDGVLYSAAPGMSTGEGNGGTQPAGCVAADGTLWLPTIEGVVRLDPGTEAEAAAPLPARIESLFVDGVSLPLDGSVAAVPGKRDVTIRFTALGLREPERVQFRYRLANRGDTWSDADTRREAVYTGLPPGVTIFEVSARNEDGVWSRAPTRLYVRLEPHVWETTGFGVSVSLAVLLAAAVVLRRRALRERAQRHELEELVQARTRELESEVDVRRATEQRLREARDELELRVEQRTGELADALHTLQADVERRQQLERQLLQSQKLEGVGRLAGGVAHDFNNLLTVIRGCAEGLEEKLPAPAEELTEIHEATDRAARLTRQLLSFARQDVVRRRVLDLVPVVRDVSALLHRLLGEEIELVTDTGSEPVPVHADPNQLEQVLVNLCVNARDAMPRGGRIVIELGATDIRPKQATELGLTPGTYARLAVRDEGEGMAPDVAQHVFEPFFTTKEEGRGSGLGLSTCYGIVRDLGGHIDVDTALGEGTTITVLLPRSDKAIAPQEVARPAEVLRGDGTVLLVEDQEAVRRALASMLSSLGFDVLQADGGVQALQLAVEHADDIDVVLCDVVMPGMRGPELLGALREAGLGAPAVLMTGHADEPLPAELAHAVIVKPPTRRELVDVLRDARA